MKYAHLADLHLGSWRDEKMRDLSTKAFMQVMDECIRMNLDFILFAGDLFNTSLPALDILKVVTKKLKEVKEADIPIYIIAGSHDFSPSGKTMIDVLENAGLLVNVCKGDINQETRELELRFTTDSRTGVKMTGILGRKGQLDQRYYDSLDLASLEAEEGYKIFMFHTTVAELLPTALDKIESQPLSVFPKGFNYYAGGHIHHPTLVEQPENGYPVVTYPGALFPNNFQEVEKYSKGGYYVVTVENDAQKVEWKPVEVIPHVKLVVITTHHTPEQIEQMIRDAWRQQNVKGALVTLRVKGTIENGKVSDVNFTQIFQELYEQGAYFIMKNTIKVTSNEFEHIAIADVTPEQVEDTILKEHLGQSSVFKPEQELAMMKILLTVCNTQKKEGETVTDFTKRIESEVAAILDSREAI
jgi:DNA repair protein SbcD/Mre11